MDTHTTHMSIPAKIIFQVLFIWAGSTKYIFVMMNLFNDCGQTKRARDIIFGLDTQIGDMSVHSKSYHPCFFV